MALYCLPFLLVFFFYNHNIHIATAGQFTAYNLLTPGAKTRVLEIRQGVQLPKGHCA